MSEERNSKRLVPKPLWISWLESKIAGTIRVHPNVISAFKLLVITPAIFLALKQIDVIPGGSTLVLLLFLGFASLDYIDGIVAREHDLATNFGKLFDRVTDYPLLVIVSWYSIDFVSLGLVASKLFLDGILLILFAMGKGNTENRLRTGLNYTTVISLLFLSQGWGPQFLTESFVETLLILSIVFSSLVALHNLGVIGRFLIADMLSGANLICGIFSMIYASRGRYDLSLLLLMIGGAFDGLDGAAARRWGGTRFGVYADDIADGVNYGIAPGVALYFALGGVVGTVIGVFFALFTISRLVYFTLNKSDADPNYFSGVPSTIGGLITMTGIILFADAPAMIGFLVGIACVQMVSFETSFRHLGRAVADRKQQVAYGLPAILILLYVMLEFAGIKPAVWMVLGLCLFYGFLPTAQSFKRVLFPRESLS